jgi:hypothetical protein
VVINRGPDYRTVEKATGRTIQEARIETVARVAPYDHVSRAQLAVEPGTEKRGVRVAEPVPASQPLPSASQQGRPSGQGHGQQPAVAPTAAAASTGHQNKSNGQPDAAQQQQHAKAQQDAAQQQQHAKAQADAAQQQQHAKAQQDAKAKADPKAKKDQPEKKDQGSDKGTDQPPH